MSNQSETRSPTGATGPGLTFINRSDIQACAVCGSVLAWFIPARGVPVLMHPPEAALLHPEVPSHGPVPVPVASLQQAIKCDFCSDANATHELPVQTFTRLEGNVVRTFQGNWAACGMCVAFLEANDWAGLSAAAYSRMTARAGRSSTGTGRRYARELHAEVRRHQLGPVRVLGGDVR